MSVAVRTTFVASTFMLIVSDHSDKQKFLQMGVVEFRVFTFKPCCCPDGHKSHLNRRHRVAISILICSFIRFRSIEAINIHL
jgi:hypothetical protein